MKVGQEVSTEYGLGTIVSFVIFNTVKYVKLKMVSGLNLVLPKSRVK